MQTTITGVLAAALAFGSVAQAHMQLLSPAPYRAKNNPNANPNTIDYSMTAPLSGSAQYPCKGYHVDFGTAAGKSVATWPAGSSTKFSVTGGATHGGGSCQASLSYDKGATFTVVASFEGSCPLSDGAEFPFTVPSDAPAGDAIFAWTWFNKIGNREIYMNCATVTISSGVGKARRADTAFSSRPEIFKANLGDGCATVEGKEVLFPDPGPDVVDKQTGDNTGSLTGCSAAVDSGDSPAASSAAPVASAAPASSAAAVSSAVAVPSGGVFATVAPASSSAVAATSAAPAVSVVPTTMATVASPTAAASSSVVSSASEVASAVTPSGTASVDPVASAVPSTGTTTGAMSGACSPEGLWNCIGGTAYQQCASGIWSVEMQLAAGTKCTAGQTDAIDITAM